MSHESARGHLKGMTWQDLRSGADVSYAVLPVGAVEPHGPHLPLTADTVISEYLAARLAERIRAYVMPSVGYGVSTPPFRLGGHFPGVFAVSGSTFTSLVEDLLGAIHDHGTRDVVVVNSAIDNTSFLYEAARRHHVRRPDSRTMVVSWWDVVGEDFRDELAEETGVDRRDDHHAAMVESSLVMHMAPDLVRHHLVANTSGPDSGTGPRRIGYHMVPLPTDCENDSGIVYRADLATAEIGARVCEQVVRELARAVHREFGERKAEA